MAANVTDSAKVFKKEMGIYGCRNNGAGRLISKIVAQRKPGIDCCLRECRGNGKF